MKKDSSIYIFIFIILISVVFGLAISAVHFYTLPMMQKNETLHRNRIIAQAFLLEVKESTPEAFQRAITEEIKIDTIQVENESMVVLNHKSTGKIGFVFDGMGFWEPISGVVVFDSDMENIINLKIL